MSGLDYSIDALSAKSLFYNKSMSVYVEGPDDVVFWDHIFKIAEVQVHVEDVGGKPELEKMYSQIVEQNAEFCIAMDNDNTEFMVGSISHPHIIRTYGYSIENSMYYSKNTISKHIESLSRTTIDHVQIIEEWIEEFSAHSKELVIYDIANNRFQKGISVFGDNCFRLLKEQKSPKLCSLKIAAFINSIKDFFSPAEIDEVRNIITASDKEIWFMIKGHFITHSLLNLIKDTIKKHTGSYPSYPNDMLYATTVRCIDDWDERKDIKYLIDQIRAI